MMDGRLIVLEGPDGVGKTTVADALCECLQQSGRTARVVALPGRTPHSLGALVYRLHHDEKAFDLAGMGDLPRQIMHVAAHADTIAREIVPAIRRGETVVLDRFWWSTVAYARAAKLSEAAVAPLKEMAKSLWQELPKAAVFLIERDEPLRDEPLALWRSLVGEYRRLASESASGERIETVRNDRSADATAQQILASVLAELREQGMAKQQGLDFEGRGGAKPPFGFSKLAPAKTSPVYDTLWKFAAERQRIFFARATGALYRTADPILQKHKFTNAYRASDRVSQYLIRNVIYDGEQSASEVFFRTLLFKFFNRIETWELLVAKFGTPVSREFDARKYGRVLEGAMKRGERVYSAAYIMPSGGPKSEFGRKHDMHLALLGRMMKERITERLCDCAGMKDAFLVLRSYPTIGDFLAYQYVTDLNYSTIWNFNEMEFVVPGPGALDGLRKCFTDQGGLSDAEIIRVVTERQEQEFERLQLDFRNLWGRRLQLIDCQNLFCEISKYARIAHPEIAGISNRTRIKQVYTLNEAPIHYWYPPKWGINERLPKAAGPGAVARTSHPSLIAEGER